MSKEKIHIILKSLRLFSISLFLISFILLFLSAYTLFNFFSSNSNLFFSFSLENLDEREFKILNPGPLKIDIVELSLKIFIFNKTIDFFNFKESLKVGKYSSMKLNYQNRQFLTREISSYISQIFERHREFNKIRSILSEELNNSRIVGIFRTSIDRFLNFSITFEINLSHLIKI